MRTSTFLCVLVSLLSMSTALAAAAVPVVHQDEFLTIRAGVPEVGRRPAHVGDALSLLIEVEFDAERLRVETLDGALFRRAFTDRKAFALRDDPVVQRETDAGGRTLIRASWTFQILDCPAGLTQCAGHKSYELPVIDVAYQLLGRSGDAVNEKSVRFRPWPGTLPLTPAVNAVTGSPDEFARAFPGGAYQEALPVEDRRGLAFLTGLAGTLILVAGIRRARWRSAPPAAAIQAPRALTRWQAVLAHLEAGELSDDEWADAIRRCITWYCVDELSANPCQWLENGAPGQGRAPASLTGFRTLFIAVLQEERIAPQQRRYWLDRFLRVVENPADDASGSAPN